MVDPSVRTYRSLRIGIVGAVVTLAVSIGIERVAVDCWQTSISGYYYTPVRAILVGALMAVGLSLVVIRGRTQVEDGLLNIAGMLAPLVAVVPTTTVGRCWSVPPGRFPLDDDAFIAMFEAAIRNNVWALVVAGFVGLVVAQVVGTATTHTALAVRTLEPASRWAFVVAAGLVVAVGLGLWRWPGFATTTHDLAAIAMFALLVGAVVSNAYRQVGRADRAARRYRNLYGGIAIGMVVSMGLFLPPLARWQHRVFVVEAIVIVLFGSFWVVQTRELWDEGASSREPPRTTASP